MPTVEELINKGRTIAAEYAKDGHPKLGIAYWRYAAVKYNSKLYIIEWHPVGDDLETITKEVSY
jgi:hypothetical protein